MLDKAREFVNRIGRTHDAYKMTFTSPDGQIVIRDLCKRFHVINPTFTTEPYETAFKEGQRHVVMSILRYVNKDKSALIKQIEEGLEEDDHEMV